MNVRVGAVFAVVVLLVLVGVGISSSLNPLAQNQTAPNHATLEDLIAGRFPSALDKAGTGGVTVRVEGLFVLQVEQESDGDWHVTVTDGKVRVFITEITPHFQDRLGKPTVGTTIDETGVPFCDTFHENESWHGDNCWEIHPVTAWRVSSTTLKITAPLFLQGVYAQISYAHDPIQRGSTQTVTVRVNDSDGSAPNKTVFIHLVYASGTTARDFSCTTDAYGACSVSWTIENDASPGTFTMTAIVDGVVFFSSFDVTT